MNGQDKQSEKSFYDRLFSTRQKFDQFNDTVYRRVAAEVSRHAEGGGILELGCGSGSQAVFLLERGFSVVAADLSIEAVKLARAGAAASSHDLPVTNADAEMLPLKTDSIDGCNCGLLLHHFKHFDKVAAELGRVVKPGGVVVALDANAHNPLVWFAMNVVHRIRRFPGLTPNQRAITCGEIERTFRKHGFGRFEFSSVTSELKRSWLGKSLAATLNYYTRAAILAITSRALVKTSRGNMLLAVFRKVR